MAPLPKCCPSNSDPNYVPLHYTEVTPERDEFLITGDKLSLDRATDFVGSPDAGAISTFSGTTRRTFENKEVIQLEYEAYEDMAKKEWYKLVAEARKKHHLIKTSLYHRIGIVPVGESSVIIAVSSAHRADGLNAVRFLIDQLKDKLPIWKKEVLDDGSAHWKANNDPLANKSSHHDHQHHH
ncbi:Molybdopterin synthase catalytic subunit [Mycoemilia scoparia]|uniref:Molybdopterin synthase catalytic subunit n=1 Tax=Mycoemilia scoparia TaxID=417184 RepID=A0A9W8DSQ7_9FUNG|nr:Molybdopterin synthase catalytic subunit [Mycoemilia scoparia]